MARMSQSASPCGLASWMRPHMVPNAHLLKLLFPTRYTSRSIYQSSMCDSQSASSCGLASWMRTQECNTSMIPDTHSLKLLFPTRYTSRSIYLCSYQSASSCRLTFWIYIAAIYYCDAPAFLPFHKKFKHPHTVDEYSHKSNERKTLTVLRRNSIIIVNCSAENI